MTWTPTEGERRADALMREMLDSAKALGVPLASTEFPMHHARVFGMIAKALDQALAEVPANAREALDKAMMDNFPGTLAGNPQSSGLWVPVGNGTGNGHANPDDYSELPIARVGSDVNSEASLTWGKGTAPHVQAEPLPPPVSFAVQPEEPPKKRRGRPPGSKAKAAKPAKAKRSKSDKLLAKIAKERAPVLQALADAPVAETVATAVPEQVEAPPV